MRVLVVNAGSSSVKIRLLDPDNTLRHEVNLDAERGQPQPGAVATAIKNIGSVDAVGHRVVHGATSFTGPVVVDAVVLAKLDQLVALAPLHQPPALAALRTTLEVLPDVPSVACFDTAFHTTLPPAAATYAIPDPWRTNLGVRRYGFHGLAHQWAAHRAGELTSPSARIVVAHLGAGASLCAVRDGRSVDTTMGFTPTAGLVMASRCGDLDPAVPLWLVQHAGLAAGEVAGALDHHSGLTGLAGTPDMRAVLAAEHSGDAAAELAIAVWLHRLRREIAAMAAALGGLDVLVFSGGIGEHQPQLRARTVTGLGFLGLDLDPAANEAIRPSCDADISTPDASVRTLVVHAREDLVIADQVRATLRGNDIAPMGVTGTSTIQELN
ncbi:MAG TPA: acetate/propionate family kinase [Pseudonocardiaceae bacterium]|nr:acetate/propionate family kinase [Pseudonocardiaceae bacterium]